MATEPFLPGYGVYLLEVLLPGVGFGELLGIWGETGLAERIGMAFGLGLGIDTLVILVRTSGLPLGGFRLAGLDVYTIFFLIGGGAAVLMVSVILNRRFSMAVKPRWNDVAVFVVIMVLGAMLALYFQKYPIFPEYNSSDFAAHVQTSEGLVSGTVVSIPSGLLYYGVHYQIGSAFLLVGGERLVTARVTMATLVLLSPLLLYWVAGVVAEDRRAGLVAAAVYSLSATVWFNSVFDAGLYPNFFGILAVLFFVGSIGRLSDSLGAARLWVVFFLALITVAFSHYTAVTIVPALFVLPVVQAFREGKKALRLFTPPLLVAAPGVVVALAYPSLVSKLISLAFAGGGRTVGTTPLAGVLSGLPVLGYMAFLTYDDVAFVTMLALVVAYAVWGRAKKGLYFVPLVWFVSLVGTSPISIDAWRFAYEALVPLVMMAGLGFFAVLPKKGFERKRRGSSKSVWLVLTTSVLLLLLLFGSWGTTVVSDSLDSPGQFAGIQGQVYDAIYWLGAHTPQNSTYLSVSDFRFTYSSLFIGRTTYYQFISQPSNATAEAQKVGAKYIVVTLGVTENVPPVPELFPWNNFPPSGSSTLRLVYNMTDVRVYKIA